MGGKNRELRTGNQTKRIYPRVAVALETLRDLNFMHYAEDATGMSSESISQCIRNTEAKLGVRLFVRRRGRGNSQWLPIITPRTASAWAAIADAKGFELVFGERLTLKGAA